MKRLGSAGFFMTKRFSILSASSFRTRKTSVSHSIVLLVNTSSAFSDTRGIVGYGSVEQPSLIAVEHVGQLVCFYQINDFRFSLGHVVDVDDVKFIIRLVQVPRDVMSVFETDQPSVGRLKTVFPK